MKAIPAAQDVEGEVIHTHGLRLPDFQRGLSPLSPSALKRSLLQPDQTLCSHMFGKTRGFSPTLQPKTLPVMKTEIQKKKFFVSVNNFS